MQDTRTDSIVRLDQVRSLLGEHGYEIDGDAKAHPTDTALDVLVVKDPESGLTVRCVLEDNILFNTIQCATVSRAKLTPEVLFRLLDAGNGISTSSFQLYERPDGNVTLALNNFCKLQSMGDDDADDILSCLEFLAVDAYAARSLIGDQLA
jgi:hypothetical protein